MEVEWIDAAIETEFDGNLRDIRSGLVVNQTIGYLVRKSAREIILVMDRSPEENTIRWTYSIPGSMKPKITYLQPVPSGETVNE